MAYGFKIVVSGKYACFSRPELKVERVSYDVPTPSALEGMLKSVYWKPAIRYVIDEIVVFNPIRFANIRRNEVKDKISLSKAKEQMKTQKEVVTIYASESRNQRASIILQDVKYGISFHFEKTGLKDGKEQDLDAEAKHYNILKRRLEKGQYFRIPCLGCSEFPVSEMSIVEAFDLHEIAEELANDADNDLGFMLYGMRFEDGGKPINNSWESPKFSDKADAQYYRPHLCHGIIDVAKYAEEIKC